MSDAAEILVIILSIFLAFFLALAIALTVMLIKVTRQIKTITESAQSTVDNVNKFVEGATRATSPAVLAKLIFNQVKKMRNKE